MAIQAKRRVVWQKKQQYYNTTITHLFPFLHMVFHMYVTTNKDLINIFQMIYFKVGLSPSKKICVICFIESPLKVMKNAFYFILKALFVLKIFKFLSRLFGHVGKRLD